MTMVGQMFSILYFLFFCGVIFSITYLKYVHCTKNPIIGWVVNRIPLEFYFFIFIFLFNFILNRDVAWADGTGYSYDPAQLIQPQVNPPIEWGEENFNVFVPDIPVLEQPLIFDEVRRVELYHRLAPHSFVQELRLKTIVDLVYQQAEVEKKIEATLVRDGIPRMRVLFELNRLRGVLFYPQGTPLSPATLARYLREIAQSGTRQSTPYRRVYRAIRNYELFIDLLFLFNNNNQ
uniref:Uncharacterized protein n=1 Tax=Bougainvillea spectabilis TaxID=146096 RepID=A0A7T1T1Z8_9CARY|nr:hypothetical protein KQ602_mgp05 [Bougainvillea spectabilis]QPP04919.1 hypothetical protein [Bougainvillea spectabilis]